MPERPPYETRAETETVLVEMSTTALALSLSFPEVQPRAGHYITSDWRGFYDLLLMTTLRLLALSPCLSVIVFAFSRSGTPG